MSSPKTQAWALFSCTALLAAACNPLPDVDSRVGSQADASQSGSVTDAGTDTTADASADTNATEIGSTGGTLSATGFAEVQVPAMALPATTMLYAREIPAAELPVALPLGAQAEAVELTPHGQLFDSPVTININYDPSADPNTLVVMRLDDATDVDWEVMEGATFKDGVASVQSTTFSYYTVVTFPEATCSGVAAPTAACSGTCTTDQYCSTAVACTAIAGTNLCGNTKIYAVHAGESTVDDPAADSMAAALATHCGLTVTTTSLTDSAVLQSCTNEPLVGGGNTLVMAGGPFTDLPLRYLDRRVSPVYLDTTGGTTQQYATRAGASLYSFDSTTVTSSHDYFLIQLFPDTVRGALIVSAFGTQGPGTKAAAWYFNNTVVPAIHANTRTWGKYLVVEWQDNGDLAPNAADTWTIRASDPLPPPPPVVPPVVPPPVTETPFQSNATGTLATGQTTNASAGYKFTPTATGKVTAIGGYFTGTKTVKLFQGSTILASASVVGGSTVAATTWVYKDITPVTVNAGTQYTIAVYMAGSGGAKRTSITALPQTYGNIRIDAPTQATTSIFNTTAIPTTNSSPTTIMLGIADMKFIKN